TSRSSPTELGRAVATTLDQFGPEARPALPALRQALKDEDHYVRGLALHALGQMGTEAHDTLTAMLLCLDDPVLEVRVAAIQALGSLGREGLGPDTKSVSE